MHPARKIAIAVLGIAAIASIAGIARIASFAWRHRVPVALTVAHWVTPDYQKEFDDMIHRLKDRSQSEALWSACNVLIVAQPARQYYYSFDPEVGEPIRRLNPTHIFVSTNRCCLFFDKEFRRGIVAVSRDGSQRPEAGSISLLDCLWYYDTVKNSAISNGG